MYEINNHMLQKGMPLHRVKCGGKEYLFYLDFIRTILKMQSSVNDPLNLDKKDV